MEENIENVITLDEILKSLKKHWKLIFICTMVMTISVTAFTLFLVKAKYETSTKVFIGKEQGSVEDYNSSDVQMYQQLLKTYSQVVKTRDVARGAIESGNLDLEVKDIVERLSVVTLPDTQIMEIKYVSTDPREAIEVINEIKNQFIKVAVELVPNGNIQVLEEADFPNNPVSPNVKMNIAIGFLLGLMIGVGLTFLLEFMDNSFKTKEQLEVELEIPVLGVIPIIETIN